MLYALAVDTGSPLCVMSYINKSGDITNSTDDVWLSKSKEEADNYRFKLACSGKFKSVKVVEWE